MILHRINRIQLERDGVLPNSVVLTLFDQNAPEPETLPNDNCLDHLRVEVNDVPYPMLGMNPATAEDARQILKFYFKHAPTVDNFYVQNDQGVARRNAVVSVLKAIQGEPWDYGLEEYNWPLYKALMIEAGLPLPHRPLVSVIARCQYPASYLRLFLLCLERQSYTHWQAIVVTDGPRADIRKEVEENAKVKLIETEQRKGRWGHCHRQLGIEACDGELICMSNDDNMIVPGYLEQLVYAIGLGHNMAVCDVLHNYHGWGVSESQPVRCQCDLSCWLAKAAIVKSIPWPGNFTEADGVFIEQLNEKCGGAVKIPRPLSIHN